MPLHIDIRVNNKVINQIHIGRTKGGTDPDDINNYLVVEGDTPTRWEDWYVDGMPFTHRYGDGAEVCVARALEALGYGSNQSVTNANVTDKTHPPQQFRDRSNGE